MRDLGSFSASTMNYFLIGSGNPDSMMYYMAVSNLITARILTIGGWNTANSVYLGPTNILNIAQIALCGDDPFGAQVNGGTSLLQFRGGLVNPTVTISGSNGSDRANVLVGLGGNKNGLNIGTLDLSGGTVNAMLGSVIIGQGYPSGAEGATGRGTFTMGAGSVDATNVTVGYVKTGTKAGNNGEGYLNLLGPGVLGADIFTAGDQQGSALATGTVNLAGGTLKAGVMQKGTGTVVFIWNTGTIQNRSPGTNLTISSDFPLTLQGISNHVFYADAGSTVTVNGVIGGAGTGPVVKDGAGTLLFNGMNAYTVSTIVSNGMLSGTGSISGAVTVKSGGTLSGGLTTGILTIQNNLTFEAGSTFRVQINNKDDYSQVLVTNGVIELGSSTLSVSSDMAPGTILWIINNRGAGAISGKFATVPRLTRAIYDASFETQSLTGGNDVALIFFADGTVVRVR